MWEQARKRHQHAEEELRCELLGTQTELKASILAARQSREREPRMRQKALQAQEAVHKSAAALVEEVGSLQQQMQQLKPAHWSNFNSDDAHVDSGDIHLAHTKRSLDQCRQQLAESEHQVSNFVCARKSRRGACAWKRFHSLGRDLRM